MPGSPSTLADENAFLEKWVPIIVRSPAFQADGLLFVKFPTEHLRMGERLRVLGVMEAPATWVDVTGHSVYYAFVRAVFVDPLP
jgi:hypothetical protein